MMGFPKHPFGWIFHTRETVFENPWIKLETIEARDPSGQAAQYGVVRFASMAIGIVPYEDGHVWLVGQSRVPFEDYYWEIPAGGGDASDPETCAHRELREETGLRATHLKEIIRMQTSNSVTDEDCTIFLATGLSQGENELESSEDISVMKVPLDDVLAAIDRQEIVDSLTIAAIYKLALMRSAGELDGH